MASGSGGGGQTAASGSDIVIIKPPPPESTSSSSAASDPVVANGHFEYKQLNGAATGLALEGVTDEESLEEEEEDGEEHADEEDSDNEEEMEDEEEEEELSSMSGADLAPTKNESMPTGERSKRVRKPLLKAKEIKRALEDSGQQSDDDFELTDEEEDVGEEEDEEDEDDDDEETAEEHSPQHANLTEEDENRRRSGRERKVPKKFEIEAPKPEPKGKNRKKQKATQSGLRTELVQDDSDDMDYDVKGGKRKKKFSGAQMFANSIKKMKQSSSPPSKSKKSAPPVAKTTEPQFKKLTRKVKKRRRTEPVSGDSDEESELSDVDVVSRSLKKSLGKKKAGGGVTVASSKANRARERVKYEEDRESHSSDLRSDIDEAELARQPALTEEDVDMIDFVLDHRMGKVGATGENTMYWTVKFNGDPNETLETEELEQQFLIKWKGWSHINNTWESEKSLEARKKGSLEVKGMRKLINYQNKLTEYNSWRRRASPEDIEYQEIEIEMGRQLLLTYMEVDRIFASRKNENGGKDYYVKWRNLAYSEATWEDEFNINNYYAEALDRYNTRIKTRANPRSYASAMKNVKKRFVPMKEQPDYLGNESLRLRDYQIAGINFLLNAWVKDNSLILADEMGLGKTIQTICFLKYLWHNYPFKGPMLVCVPLSTMSAWQKECEQWAPEMNMVVYNGNAVARQIIREHECYDKGGAITFNVLLTNYELVIKDRTFFEEVEWSNIVVDEAHRLKSEESLLYKVLVGMTSHHRLLLTGTPLQNSLKELWCLLNYIKPPELTEWEEFQATYGTEEDKALGYNKLHTLLKPYIIRRLKKDVEKSLPGKVEQILRVDMTVRQKRLYRLVLTKNFDALAKGKNQVSLLNIMMQLRKTCNHADLIQEGEPNPYNTPEERLQQLIYGSGKLVLLDKLLTRFREKGDRVLIFSQMVRLLDILEEYLSLKRFPFQRLDGSVSADKRKQSIAHFNAENSMDFCFLLSTKAGGLGINLQTANRVIIFDSDFNPQNDLQAIARAHRIGQKEEVKIFRLVAQSSVDEDIIQRAKNKMVLDHLVIQSMDTTGTTVLAGGGIKDRQGNVQQFNKEELNMILKFGAEDLFKEDTEVEQEKEVDLDDILERAEMREEEEEVPQSEANKELLAAFKCTTLTFEETEKDIEMEALEEKRPVEWADIIPAALLEQHRPKKGAEAYSDPEELFNPIAHRRKKRMKKSQAVESSANPSHEGSRASSLGPASDTNDHNSDSEDISDAEKEIKHQLKKMQDRQNGGGGGESRGFYAKKTTVCLKCKKRYVGATALRTHMASVHNEKDYVLLPENRLDIGAVSANESPMPPTSPAGGVSGVRRRGGKRALNTRCFRCNKTFMHRPGYKNHLKKMHGGVEPPENRDPANLAKPDDRIVCLICIKKFTTVIGLKLHIQRQHLGITAATENNEEEDEEDEKEEDDDEEVENGVKEEAENGEDPLANGEDPLGNGSSSKEDGAGEGDVALKEEQAAKSDLVNGESLDETAATIPVAKATPGTGRGGRMVRLEARPLPADLSEEEKRLIERMFYNMRKYGCRFCPIRFNNKSKLSMHEAVHAKDRRPVLCPYCERSYSRRDKLRLHISRQHEGQPIPDFSPPSPPPYGSRRFIMSGENSPASSGWMDEVGEGTEPTPRQWEALGFRQQPKYRKSEFPILDDGRFKCPECDMTFELVKLAMRHVRDIHYEEKAHKCPVCFLSYNDRKGLYQHMFRKHPRQTPMMSMSPSPSIDSPAPSPPLFARREMMMDGAGKEDGSIIQCPKCPKTYTTQGGFWIHKKTYHPELMSTGRHRKSAAVVDTGNDEDAGFYGGDTPGRASVGPNGKKFFCDVCGKYYSSYTSLYLHRRNLHPLQYPKSAPGQRRRRAQVAADQAAAISAGGSGGHNNVQVLNVGSGLEIKPHGCAKCGEKFSSLKALALHIEAGHHNRGGGGLPNGSSAEQMMNCPYCLTAVYPSRDKLNVHIRRIHPGQETVKIRQRRRRQPQQPQLLSRPSGGDNDSDVMLEEEYLNRSGSGWNQEEDGNSRKMKYKAKCFKCPACGKGYVSGQRLKNHIESRHMTKTNNGDPFAEVGPNTDIAVLNPTTEAGFDLYKVLGVYTTGLRFKCAKFSPAGGGHDDAWVLTEEVNKNVVKKDIIRIVRTMRKISGEAATPTLYGIGTAELVNLLQAANSSGGRRPGASMPSSSAHAVRSAAAAAAAAGETSMNAAAQEEEEEEVEDDADDDDEEGRDEEEDEDVEDEEDEDEVATEDEDDDAVEEEEGVDDEGDDDDDDEDDDDDDDEEDDEDEDDEEDDRAGGGRDQIMVQPVFEEGLDMEVETD